MLIKVLEAKDVALDWLVAKCVGEVHCDAMLNGSTMYGWWISGLFTDPNYWIRTDEYSPTTNWAQAGPIIERENIALYPHGDGTYEAEVFLNPKRGAGPTPLIAAMRCYCASRLGDIVEVPEELL